MSSKGLLLVHRELKRWYKRSGIYLIGLVGVFLLIGLLTSIQPAYRLSSSTLHTWTSQISGPSFLHLMSMENRLFEGAYPEDYEHIKMSEGLFQMATSIKPDDPRSFLGRELPGFSAYDGQIVVAGEGTDYTTMAVESSPPMEIFDQEEEGVVPKEGQSPAQDSPPKDQALPTTGDKDVVLIYHTHNRESYFPILPDGATDAFHSKANITLVGDRLAESLKDNGIGAKVDKTDITKQLKDKGMEYYESYDMSRAVVQEAMSSERELQYYFDLHRDAIGKEHTTAEIDGKTYARIFFIVGGEYAHYEQNLKLANELHEKMEEAYPGLSRGVMTKKGSGTNGKFNQDLSQNAMLIEFGGVENTLDELYRSADAVGEVFSDFYWQAEDQ
ncbi:MULTISPECIES: stage II sporulation protein P [Pontibacillus]|uniref:Stage II sporulation protein P n=1 Tax=Pontibacillus chungwhensis TaxID=265426 RepID=A0ABY8UZC8_9BACI|nr:MULTISPECIES: stage II sporulation protein P [Pontibacillus]MCD5323634.1 stage II sporulation protein P [Pontibacillus sp. HN14]WIF97001.1 stage II sporulation protein P [Pontibacillus chungwhensis]